MVNNIKQRRLLEEKGLGMLLVNTMQTWPEAISTNREEHSNSSPSITCNQFHKIDSESGAHGNVDKNAGRRDWCRISMRSGGTRQL